jgi:hypothetical protein
VEANLALSARMTRVEDTDEDVIIILAGAIFIAAILDLVWTNLIAALVRLIRLTIIAVRSLVVIILARTLIRIRIRIFLTGDTFVGRAGDRRSQSSRQRRWQWYLIRTFREVDLGVPDTRATMETGEVEPIVVRDLDFSLYD